MVCESPRPKFDNPAFKGIKFVNSRGDGYNIDLQWIRALSPDATAYDIAYNIYYSSRREDVFTEGVKFVATDPTQTSGTLDSFKPGDTYYFAVRATLHYDQFAKLSSLPETSNGCKIYPEAMLLSNIAATDLLIPVSDIATFPPSGIIQIGVELIGYTSIDIPANNIIVGSIANRGLFGTEARLHQTDGYDGVKFSDPLVFFFKGFEDPNIAVITEENRFDEPNFARTNADGYKERVNNITTNLSIIDDKQQDFQSFDFAGYRRTDPVNLFNGDCVGSYFGGEHFCADGYLGVGRQVRGLSFNDFNNQREEVLLSVTGEPVVLVRRKYEGILSPAVTSTKESPEHRFPNSFGTEGVTGYEQFYNPRRSDGRILVRFGPTVEDIPQQEPGRENVFIPDCWTLVYPGIQDRDFIIRFNDDGTEAFRYEILNVTRNKTVLTDSGAQKFTARRLRRTEPQYQFRTFRNTATMPQEITTSIASTPGPGGILPHMHRIVINENIVSLVQINQTTSHDRGHSHAIVNGVVQSSAGHQHSIVLP